MRRDGISEDQAQRIDRMAKLLLNMCEAYLGAAADEETRAVLLRQLTAELAEQYVYGWQDAEWQHMSH